MLLGPNVRSHTSPQTGSPVPDGCGLFPTIRAASFHAMLAGIFATLFASLNVSMAADPNDEAAKFEAATKAWEATYDEQVLPILQDRCADCHAGEDAEGHFNLDRYSSGKRVSKRSRAWKEVGKRVRLNEMPPEGSPEMTDNEKALLHQWLDARPRRDLCSSLATDETKSWYQGYVMSRRLTRTEYTNAVAALVGLPVKDPSQIPSDGAGGEGFDTAGDALFTSAIHIERYLSVAAGLIDEVLATSQNIQNQNHNDQSRKHLARQAHHQLFADVEDVTEADREDASRIIEAFAHRAWRRTVESGEVDRLLTLFDAAQSRGASFEVATGEALKAILVSPHFLFVVETETPEGGVQRLTQHQLATRLALFLWSSVPDEELLRAADEGRLDTKEQIIEQTRRMLADPRSRALGESFGLQWLGLSTFLTSVRPDPEVYPEYNEALAADLREEAVRVVWNVFRKDRSILELIDGGSMEINETLASHYDIDMDPVARTDDDEWTEIQTRDRRRGGVISLGAVLMSASYPRRTSPVLRGRWVLEELLGGRVPPPPANVPALEETHGEKEMTLRERLELHRKNPECASCHNRMDPLGFGLENFDGLGRWRERDGSLEIDSSGKLPSGETFQGPEELKQVILRRSSEFEEHFVKKLLGFALGRELNEFDQCVINDCLKGLAASEHRSSILMETIATSYPFQHRYFKAAESNQDQSSDNDDADDADEEAP
ncbi:DUF1592 domain-containing protein [Rubripirellula amarantea]|nr:DUF1592 domain-containing protein [Rubripirellula amarantea]